MAVARPVTDSGIFRLIKETLANREDIQILFYSDAYLCSTNQFLTLLGSSKHYQVNNVSITRILSGVEGEYKVVALKADSPIRERARSTGRPVDELLWQAGCRLSRGRLLTGCSSHDIAFLVQWPNFTRVHRSPNALRIAALWSGRPVALDVTARLLNIPLTEVYQFYSAARLAGYVETLSRPGTNSITSTAAGQLANDGVLKRLVGRLMSL
tara:strand:+ start:33882 stop:34517 length:636 start_codon:yes stop_codon:yes gene_type:complete